MNKSLDSKVITIKKLLAEPNLTIPVYQRPYRWTEENIADLLTDIYYQCKRIGHKLGNLCNPDNNYRLGTVVLHHKKSSPFELDIVDGQQRTLTLMLIILAASKSERFKSQLEWYSSATIRLPDCTETHKNLSNNFLLIERQVNSPEFTPDVLDFLLNQCEVVQVTLQHLSEAFQFFDSQNARGLDLSPHDLLKAFHLREFPTSENTLKQSIVEHWEQLDTRDLKLLFSTYLYPIRRWSLGQPAIHFSKANVDVFKGINFNNACYPFQQGIKVIHNTIDSYNKHPHRAIDYQEMDYPFQLTQTIINGRRFFEWVTYYQTLISPLNNFSQEDNKEKSENWLVSALYKEDKLQEISVDNDPRPTALTIFQVIANKRKEESYSYTYSWRQGDQYVRRMFNSLVLSYYDRFGEQHLTRAIEYIFIWAYTLRLQNKSVYLESIEKHIRRNNLFMRLQQSLSPVDFLNKQLPRLTKIEATNIRGIETLFKELGYYSSAKAKESANEQ